MCTHTDPMYARIGACVYECLSALRLCVSSCAARCEFCCESLTRAAIRTRVRSVGLSGGVGFAGGAGGTRARIANRRRAHLEDPLRVHSPASARSQRRSERGERAPGRQLSSSAAARRPPSRGFDGGGQFEPGRRPRPAGGPSRAAAMPLIYTSVSRGTVTLAEYAAFAGNFGSVAKDFLEKVRSCSSPSAGQGGVRGPRLRQGISPRRAGGQE
jgi:hypothetical protein